MRRFSIRGMMALTAASAVGLAALRYADEVWAGVMLLLALGLLGAGMLGVVQLRGRERASWLGFVLFEGGYLLLSMGPWFADQVQPKLGTTRALAYVHSKVSPEQVAWGTMIFRSIASGGVQPTTIDVTSVPGSPSGAVTVQARLPVQPPALALSTSGPTNAWAPRWKLLFPHAADYETFLRVGHSLFAMLAGLLGALISSRFYLRRVRAEAEMGRGAGLAVSVD